VGIVICKLPKAGLGNQLFPIMKAFVFGRLNNLEVIVTGYHWLKLGPYLRKEKTKRRYYGYFNFQKTWIGEQFDKRKIKKSEKRGVVLEPPLQVMELSAIENESFEFSEPPSYRDFFAGLNLNRSLTKEIFWELLNDSIKKKLENEKSPCIGVHIRMGDYPNLKPGEDFRHVGQVRTPEKYFIDVIQNIREVHGSSLPVTIFTDGFRNEFEHLFTLENISMSQGNPDIVDMVLLSRSEIIVTAKGSTFSYWAGFLSDVPVILHPDHIYNYNRLPSENPELYEGPMDKNNPILVRAIQKIGNTKPAFA
jgi:Glycosyl transferase family 11